MEVQSAKRMKAMASSSDTLSAAAEAQKSSEVLVGLEAAILKEDPQAISMIDFDSLDLGEMDHQLLKFLVQVCDYVWQNLRNTQFGSHTVTKLIRYCDQLKGRSYQTLWKAYNLMLTAVAADFFGLQSDALRLLRKLNFQMTFQQIVKCSPQDYKLGIFKDEEEFIRSGLAIQAWLDFCDGTALKDVHLEDIIVVTQGLVQGPFRYNREWLLLINKASEGGDPQAKMRGSEGANLDSFKANDCSDQVLPALQVVLQMQDSEMEDEACSAWFRILSPMPFVGIVKVLRRLFDVTHRPSQLLFLLSTGRGFISFRLKRTPDDGAMTELRDLLNDLYKSSKIYIEQKETETTRDQLDVVLDACRLYILIVMKLAKGPSDYQPLVLEPSELMAARRWLLLLQEQVSTAQVKAFTKEAYRYAAKVLKLALQLNDAPSEYRGGVPL